MKLSKGLLRFVLYITIPLIIAGVFWQVSDNKKTEQVQSEALPSAKVVRGSLEVILKGSGTLQPKDQVAVHLRKDATVRKVYFHEGDVVKKGDLLFELQDDNLEVELRKLELSLQQQQLELNEALRQKEKTTIYAPREGVLEAIKVKVGDSINSNTVLGTIVLQDRTQVRVPFNRNQVQNIKVGQEARVLLLDSLYSLEGKVTKVDSVGIPQPDGAIYYYVTISLKGNYYTKGQDRYVQATVLTDNGFEPGLEPGQIEPPEAIEIRSEVTGKVVAIHADEMRIVKKGQKLFSLDTEEIDASLERKKLALQQAQLNYESKLRELEELRVYAPIDGTILEQNIREGEQVESSSDNPGPAVIIADYSKMEVVIPIDELDVNKVKVGMPVTITAEAVPGKVFEGRVEKIAEQGVSKNNVSTFDVTVSLDKTPDLRSGMTMDVEILVAQRNDVLMVPVSAVQQKNGRSFVMLLHDEEAGSSTNSEGDRELPGQILEVRTGISNEDFIEILSGLKENDRVLVRFEAAAESGRSFGPGNRMFQPGLNRGSRR